MELEETGCLLLRSECKEDLRLVATQLGTVIAQAGYPQVQKLRPIPNGMARARSLSSRYGLQGFPFHTDCAHWSSPARYVILRAINNGLDASTHICDSAPLSQCAIAEGWERSVFVVRDVRQPFLCSVVNRTKSGVCFRWDQACMSPLDARSQAIFGELRRTIEERGKDASVEVKWDAVGTTLILDNWRMLHARSIVQAGSRRELERVFVI
jgi:L-asparagine oxygenase